MSQEAETLALKPVQILSPQDSRAGLVRDPDEGFADRPNARDAAESEKDNRAKHQSNGLSTQPREITFEGTLRINGYAAGVIRSSEGSLIVEAGGEVDADISVRDATIHGCVRGDIHAKQKVDLGGSARVVGDIETVALLIEPGAVFEGRCIFMPASAASDSSTTLDSA